MSEAKHTPGPLHVVTSDRWPFDISICDKQGVVVDVLRLPAHSTRHNSFDDALNFRGNHHSESEKCREANQRALADAYLRAAAPELLEALEGILRADEWVSDASLAQDHKLQRRASKLHEESMDKARAAIAKAKGVQP